MKKVLCIIGIFLIVIGIFRVAVFGGVNNDTFLDFNIAFDKISYYADTYDLYMDGLSWCKEQAQYLLSDPIKFDSISFYKDMTDFSSESGLSVSQFFADILVPFIDVIVGVLNLLSKILAVVIFVGYYFAYLVTVAAALVLMLLGLIFY